MTSATNTDTSSRPEHQSLLWALGAPNTLPERLGGHEVADGLPLLTREQEERLYWLLVFHRVERRFLNLYDTERPGWYSDIFVAQLRKQSFHIGLRFQQYIQTLNLICHEIAQTQPQPIVAKGITAFALTGLTDNIRWVNDIDLFCEDLPAARACLERMGYAGPVKPGHEFAQMRGHGWCIELHRHLMVFSGPSGIQRFDSFPENNPGIWRQPPLGCHEVHLEYRHLREHAVHSPVSGFEALLVADPSLAAIIACAHEFREFITMPWRQSRVKLGILAGLLDVVRLPAFSVEAFKAAVNDLGAADAVDFSRFITAELWGQSPIPEVNESSEETQVRTSHTGLVQSLTPISSFETATTSPSFWVQALCPEDLLEPFDPVGYFSRIQTNEVRADGTIYAAFNGQHDVAIPLSRLFVAAEAGKEVAFALKVTQLADKLLFDIDIPCICEPNVFYSILLVSYHYAPHKNRTCPVGVDSCKFYHHREPNTMRPEPGSYLDVPGRVYAKLDQVDSGLCFQIGFYNEALLPSFRDDPLRPLMLRVARWQGNEQDIALAEATVIVPLNVHLP
jgi:hypothetical protein